MSQEAARPSGLSYCLVGACLLAESLLFVMMVFTTIGKTLPGDLMAWVLHWLLVLLSSLAIVFALAQEMLDRRAIRGVRPVWAFAGSFGLLYLVLSFVLARLMGAVFEWIGYGAGITAVILTAMWWVASWMPSLLSGWLALRGSLYMFRGRIVRSPVGAPVSQPVRASLLFAGLYSACVYSGLQFVAAISHQEWVGDSQWMLLALCISDLLVWAGAWRGMRGFVGSIQVGRVALAAMLTALCHSLWGGLLFLISWVLIVGGAGYFAIGAVLLLFVPLFPMAWGFTRLLGAPSRKNAATA